MMDDENTESNPFSFKTFLKRGEGAPVSPSGSKKESSKQVTGKNEAPRKKGSKKKTKSLFPEENEVVGKRQS